MRQRRRRATLRGRKIRIYPNKAQETYLRKACGTARFAFNRALGKWMGEHADMAEMAALTEARETDCSPDGKKPRRQARKERKDAVAKAENDLRGALLARGGRIGEGGYRRELNRQKKRIIRGCMMQRNAPRNSRSKMISPAR
jgi:hypothetical protein